MAPSQRLPTHGKTQRESGVLMAQAVAPGWAKTRGIAIHTPQRLLKHTPLKISSMYHHNTAVSPSFLQSNPLCMRSQALLVSQECVACKSVRLAIPGVHHVERAGAEKHTRSCANGPHRQTTQKGPLHPCEKQDEGSQQVQAAQSFNQRTSQAMIAPARTGARPSRCS